MEPNLNITARIMNLASNGSGNQPEPKSDRPEVNKFVIIRTSDSLYLVYGPLDEYFYHADLVKKYCELNSIPSGWLKKPAQYEIYGNAHRVKGGGWLEEKPKEKHVRVFGSSTAYGRFQRDDIAYLLQNAPEYRPYRISIER